MMLSVGFLAICAGLILVYLIGRVVSASRGDAPRTGGGWTALLAVFVVGGCLLIYGLRGAAPGSRFGGGVPATQYVSMESAAEACIWQARQELRSLMVSEGPPPGLTVVEVIPEDALDEAMLGRIAEKLNKRSRTPIELKLRGKAAPVEEHVSVVFQITDAADERHVHASAARVRDGKELGRSVVPDVVCAIEDAAQNGKADRAAAAARETKSRRGAPGATNGAGGRGRLSQWGLPGQLIAAGTFAVMLVLAYLFLDAGTRGHYTTRLRIGAATAFVIVAALLWRFGAKW